jgi:PKD repeat protein
MIVAGLAAVATLSVAPSAQAVTLPAAPSGLAASYGSGIIALMWADNAADETGFEVERCTATSTGCVFAPLATTLANQYAFADQSPFGPYAYRVRAVNGAGVSAWSATASLPTGIGGFPTAVLLASPTTGTTPLTVAFDGSQSTWLELSVITNWSWSFGDGTTATGPLVSHVYSTPGTYRATLTVSNARGVANLAQTTITVAGPVMTAPTNLTASSTVRRRVDLRWTNASGSSATSLVVQRCTGATCAVFSTVATLPVTATTWSDSTVRSGTTYRYVVAATNGLLTSISNVASARAR